MNGHEFIFNISGADVSGGCKGAHRAAIHEYFTNTRKRAGIRAFVLNSWTGMKDNLYLARQQDPPLPDNHRHEGVY